MHRIKRKHRTPARPAAPANDPAAGSFREFLLTAVAAPPGEELSEEDAAADARVCRFLERMAEPLAGDQADQTLPPPPPAAGCAGRRRPPRKPR